MSLTIGIDVGGTKLLGGVVDENGNAGAAGVEPEGVLRADVQGLTWFEDGVGFRQGDQGMGPEREVQAGLVAEMFDAGDGGGLAPL